MNRKEKIDKCTKWFKTLKIGDTIIDLKHRRHNKITDLTNNSVELYHTKITDKGINCKQYYDIDRLAFLTDDYVYYHLQQEDKISLMKNKNKKMLKDIGILLAICCGIATYLMWAIAILKN